MVVENLLRGIKLDRVVHANLRELQESSTITDEGLVLFTDNFIELWMETCGSEIAWRSVTLRAGRLEAHESSTNEIISGKLTSRALHDAVVFTRRGAILSY